MNFRNLFSKSIISLVLLVGYPPLHHHSAKAENRSPKALPIVKVGLFMGADNYFRIHQKSMLQDFEKTTSNPHPYRFQAKFQFYPNAEDFLKDMNQKKLDYAFSNLPDHFFNHQKKLALVPLGLFGLSGNKGIPYCLTILKTKQFPSLKSFKGKSLAMPPSKVLFFHLAQALNENPADFFSSIQWVNSGTIGGKAVDSKLADAALIPEVESLFIKIFNPPLHQRIMKSFCFRDIESPPFFRVGPAKNPQSDLWIRDLFKHPEKFPSIQHLIRMKNIFSIQTHPTHANSLTKTFNLIKKGEKLGWSNWFMDARKKSP